MGERVNVLRRFLRILRPEQRSQKDLPWIFIAFGEGAGLKLVGESLVRNCI